MSKHLKTRVSNGIADKLATLVRLPQDTPHKRSVTYFTLNTAIKEVRGAMDAVKLGNKYRKRIVMRPSRHRPGLHELYTFHFPKSWSVACRANRALMAEARRRAHEIERDHSYAGLEWRIRHIAHLFNPEPGIKPYHRLFHFAYMVIQLELRAASKPAPSVEDVTFEPIMPYRPVHRHTGRVHSLCRFTPHKPCFVQPHFPFPPPNDRITFYLHKKQPQNLHMSDFYRTFAV